jgi:cell division protein FtsI (penicillin-binding protein 3)
MKRAQYIPVSPWRLHLVAIVIAILFSMLVWRIVSLQVLDTDRGYAFLQDQGEARYVRTAEIPAYRGIISDRRGEPLAVSTPVISLWADPGKVTASGRVDELAEAMAVTPLKLQQRLARYAGKEFIYLRRHMTPVDARRILRLKIEGVGGRREYQRYYPAGEVAAHLVGFTNVDEQGIEGIELAYDGWLQGTPGSKQVIKDLHGDVVRDIGELRAANPGRDLQLSIDLRLQYLAHRELQRAVTLSGANSGTVVTLDSRTGEVLAMVNHPTYNPNARRQLEAGQTRNRALTDVFEPGSTMKPLTLVAALESGRFSPDTMIDTSPGWIKIGSKILPDPVNHGVISVAQVVAKSSQVGIVKIAMQLDEQSLWATFNRFGLGAHPGTGFPGESAGVLPYRDKWRPIEQATLAYGYGLAVSPLQLARAYAVIASGGKLLTPSLLRLTEDSPLPEQVLEPRIARQVLAVLRGATREGGTAHRARVDGYSVAGKTGTAHKASRNGYSDDRYLAFFAGMAPASNPRLVTIVLLDEPKGDRYFGGEIAAPVFSRITAGALRLLNVVPDQPQAGGSA